VGLDDTKKRLDHFYNLLNRGKFCRAAMYAADNSSDELFIVLIDMRCEIFVGLRRELAKIQYQN